MKNRLKELRESKKLSQKKFAKAFNHFITSNKNYTLYDGKGKEKEISYATVSRWENGKTPIPSTYYIGLSSFFNVSIEYLLGFSNLPDNIQYSLCEILTFEYFDDLDFDNSKQIISNNDLANNVNKFIKAQSISKYPLDFYTVSSFDDLIKLDDEKEPDPQSEMIPELEKYWLKYFHFLFEDKSLILLVNTFMEKGGSTYSPTNEIVNLINKDINEYLLKYSATKAGKKILDKYLNKLDSKYFELLTNISLINSKSDLENAIFAFNDFLDDLKFNVEKKK